MKNLSFLVSVASACVLCFLLQGTSAHLECKFNNDMQSYLDSNNTQSVLMLDPVAHEFHTQAAARAPMRFLVDQTNINDPTKYCTTVGQVVPNFVGGTATCTAADILTDSVRSLMMNTIIPAAVGYLSQALLVDNVVGGYTVPASTCGADLLVPASYQSSPGVQADYVIFITAGPVASSGVLAFAGSCAYFSSTSRPAVGMANFNPTALANGSLNISTKIKVAIHEIMHALGFSNSFASSRFLAPNNKPIQSVTIRGKTAQMITTPQVVAQARTFFNCPTLTGVELEDQGGSGTAGSHWEKRTLLNEVMVGVTTGGEVTYAVSPMTLAFFADSGHYDANYHVASPTYQLWTYGAGCDFLNNKCNTAAGGLGKYFCFDQNNGCTIDYHAISICILTTYSSALPTEFQYNNPTEGGSVAVTDYCPYQMGYSNYLCVDGTLPATPAFTGMYFGADSRCFQTTDSDGTVNRFGLKLPKATNIIGTGQRCLRARCVNDVLQVQPGGLTVWIPCPVNGGSVSIGNGFLGNVVCPASSVMCPSLPSIIE